MLMMVSDKKNKNFYQKMVDIQKERKINFHLIKEPKPISLYHIINLIIIQSNLSLYLLVIKCHK